MTPEEKLITVCKNIIKYSINPEFQNQISEREQRCVSAKSDKELFEIYVNIIAYSQNATSSAVETVINSGVLKTIFKDFDQNEVSKMNPCDIADEHWEQIKGIRQQTKLFQIVTLARKLNKHGSLAKSIEKFKIPKKIESIDHIDKFWVGFKKIINEFEKNSIPFFRSPTTLLHLLMDLGYDCIKPDTAVIKAAHKIGFIDKDNVSENKKLEIVRFAQQFAIKTNLRPAELDLFLLIYGEQTGAVNLVSNSFYTTSQT